MSGTVRSGHGFIMYRKAFIMKRIEWRLNMIKFGELSSFIGCTTLIYLKDDNGNSLGAFEPCDSNYIKYNTCNIKGIYPTNKGELEVVIYR